MAWVAFQKSNWTRSVGPQKMIQYFPASSNGTATGNLTFGTAATTNNITLTAAFQFKGNGAIEAFPPEGNSGFATAAAQGVQIGTAWLQGPAAGNYAAGNHPVIILQLLGTKPFTTAATGFDLIVMQS